MAKVSLSAAQLVERGYGQVEPNHLSAQRNGQVYGQLPADPNITKLENGQFVKYNYALGQATFEKTKAAEGEWMLVFNEVKVYRDWESDADFAMLKDNYVARVYSPIDGEASMKQMTASRYYGGVDEDGHEIRVDANGNVVAYGSADYATATPARKVVTPADPYEWDSTANPFQSTWDYAGPKAMPTGATMTPRVFKTMVGDIYTTNMVDEAWGDLTIGTILAPTPADGILRTSTNGGDTAAMKWQVVKRYDLGDRQKAVKIMRIA